MYTTQSWVFSLLLKEFRITLQTYNLARGNWFDTDKYGIVILLSNPLKIWNHLKGVKSDNMKTVKTLKVSKPSPRGRTHKKCT